MTRLVRAEWIKVFTVKLCWGLLLASIAITAIAVVAQISSGTPGLSLGSSSTQRSFFASADVAEIFSLVLGIAIITTEYRHLTSRPTFLIEPRRGRVVAAKVAVSALLGLIYGACCVAVVAAIAGSWLATRHLGVDWGSADVLGAILGALVVVTLYAVLGLGVGVLVHNQIAALVGSFAFLFILEPTILLIPGVERIYPYLPGAAASAITQPANQLQAGVETLLAPWQGVLVLMGWGLLLAVVGWAVSVRRDVP